MKKKGFTLIELLAVIVILAIIAIISAPIITDLINKSRYGAFGVTKKNIEHAAELYYAKNTDDVYWEDNIAYVTIGTLKSKKFLRNNVVNTLDSTSINDDTKVLLYRKGRKIDYSLQLYDEQFFDWYQGQMVQASKGEDITLPTTVGETVTVDLETLMGKGLVDELRLPLELDSRCVGYVEIEKTTDNYEYNAYVDCLQGASTFASHYVSYGGKYLDEFNSVKETSDGGYIAVGRSNSEVITKYGNTGKGKYDAIIVKFKNDGTVEWSKNFGGSSNDLFNGVIETTDGYVAVGQTYSNDGDVIDYNGGDSDALIVKYDTKGNVLYKKSFGTGGDGPNSGEYFFDIINDVDNFIVIGQVDGREKNGDLSDETRSLYRTEGIIVKFDKDFNKIWMSCFSGNGFEDFYNIIKDNNNNYVIVGSSDSSIGDMSGIGYEVTQSRVAIIIKYNSEGKLISKQSFKGINGNEFFSGLIEVDGGYIVTGYAESSDLDMTNLSKAENGYRDALIIKYDYDLNIIWKKTFGGSLDEEFTSIVKENKAEVIAVGYSKSNDMDMNNMTTSTGGYSAAIMVKYNTSDGNIINKKSFSGNSSESFKKVIKLNSNNYVAAGSSFSVEKDLKNFNKGHSDAILVNFDNEFNLLKNFQEPVVIIDKLKKIEPAYGSDFKTKYNQIYTSNDPEKDLMGWCSNYDLYLPGNTSNYYYTECLKSFNVDDKKLLVNKETRSGLKVFQGNYEYKITETFDNIFNWINIEFNGRSAGNNIEFSNLKLKFHDGYVGSIMDSIDNNYIEPLVIIYTYAMDVNPARILPTVIDIVNENGRTGVASGPQMMIIIKPKKSQLSSIYLTSNEDSRGANGLSIFELRNFDMSVTPTE